MVADPVEVTLTLLNETPERVAGPRAFVLYQPDVGRVEVGTPLPGEEIWNHFSGDLRYTVVHDMDGGMTGGGGLPWDHDELDVLWSEPGSGDNPDERAWVVVGRIPSQCKSVIVEHGGQRFVQRPIRDAAVFPLAHTGGPQFRIFGVGENGIETLLFEV